jgi:thioesterase domain-containing protein
VAFEVARQLNAQGAELGLVGVLQFDVHDMPFAPFDYLDLRSIYNFLKNLFPSVAEFFRIGKAERNTSIMRLFYKLVRLPGDTEESYPPLTVERTLQDAHELAWRRYVPTAFPGVMTVFRPHRLPVLHPDPKLGWGLIEGQRLEVQTVSGWGIHGDCISSRNGAAMAKVIEKAIETRERELR